MMTGPWNELTIFRFASPLELCHIVVLPLIILSLRSSTVPVHYLHIYSFWLQVSRVSDRNYGVTLSLNLEQSYSLVYRDISHRTLSVPCKYRRSFYFIWPSYSLPSNWAVHVSCVAYHPIRHSYCNATLSRICKCHVWHSLHFLHFLHFLGVLGPLLLHFYQLYR